MARRFLTDVDLGGILLSGATGVAGQVLSSGGPGAPAFWATPFSIPVGTTAPSSPNVNDLWVDTNP